MNWIQSLPKAIHYIENHLTDDIDIDDVSSQAYTSSSHFQLIFHVVIGLTVGEYNRYRRLSVFMMLSIAVLIIFMWIRKIKPAQVGFIKMEKDSAKTVLYFAPLIIAKIGFLFYGFQYYKMEVIMKKIYAIIIVMIGLFYVTATAYADSPVTSTPFSKAYYHIDIVKEASGRNTITADMAAYLADANNPIDVKAAIINALSWNTDGKDNAERYCQFIYGKAIKDMDASALPGDQQFCIGYLLAMDDIYFETSESIEYMKMARSNINDSLTVAIVTFLVETMNEVSYDWPGQLNQILADTSLNKDISEDAITVITDYMLLGIDNPVNTPKTGTFSLGALYGVGAIILLIAAVMCNANKEVAKI